MKSKSRPFKPGSRANRFDETLALESQFREQTMTAADAAKVTALS
jgi:hypothetical protein